MVSAKRFASDLTKHGTPTTGPCCTGVCQATDPTPVIRELLNHGAHPNAAADSGATALHLAAATGNARAIQALAAASEDLDLAAALPESRFTALHLAVASADLQSVKLLMSFGAAPSAEAHHAVQPLHIAAYLGVPDIVQALLDGGATPRSAESGLTPLHCASSLARAELVQPAVEAVACVDWLGKLPVSAHLMQALAHSVAEDATNGLERRADTAVLRKVSAVQQVHKHSKLQTRRSWVPPAAKGAAAQPVADSPSSGVRSESPLCHARGSAKYT